MSREIYPKVKLIIKNASKEAKSFDDIKIRPAHLVLSILIDNDNEGVKILKKLGVDTTDFYDTISDSVRKTELSVQIGNGSAKITLKLSDESKAIIKLLDKECEEIDDKIIDTTHMILAILSIKSSITQLFIDVGVTYLKYKKMIRDTKKDFTTNLYKYKQHI